MGETSIVMSDRSSHHEIGGSTRKEVGRAAAPEETQWGAGGRRTERMGSYLGIFFLLSCWGMGICVHEKIWNKYDLCYLIILGLKWL